MAKPFTHQEDTVTSLFATTATTHTTDCTGCTDAVRSAVIHARVTGSIGATYGTEGGCEATVARVTVETIPASELAPGDVVLDGNGDRLFAAFDVAFDADRGRYVTAWTSVADQQAGLPDQLHLIPIAPVTVQRRVGGPRVTRTTLAVECPACRYTSGHTSWCPER